MKRTWPTALLLILLLTACGPSAKTTVPRPPTAAASTPAATATAAPATTTASGVSRLRPGVYAVDDIATLPLSTSGYDLYLIGETHGQVEVQVLALGYLERLHEAIGLRDLALELSPRYEQALNEYVLGQRDALPDPGYWDAAGMGIPDGVRALNADLPEGERIRVHLVDLDYTAPMIHAHLVALHETLGVTTVPIPSLSQFEQMDEVAVLELIDQLAGSVTGGAVAHELTGLRDSVRFHYALERAGQWYDAPDELSAIREAATAQNIQDLRNELQGAPVLVLCGAWHAQKRLAVRATRAGNDTEFTAIQEAPWAQRLAEAGVAIHALYVQGLSGHTHVRGRRIPIDLDPSQLHFADGTTLSDTLALVPAHDILYIDLRVEENASARFGEHFDPNSLFDPDVPAGEVYDGLVLFREVTAVR